MRTAICSAGPSLLRTFDPNYDTVIAVNHACNSVPYDWACIGDIDMLGMLKTPITIDHSVCAPNRLLKTLPKGVVSVAWEGLVLPVTPSRETGSMFSVVAAISLAAFFNPHQRVDIYGMDWGGTTKCDGTPYFDDYPSHWKGEREDIAAVCALHPGLTVTRVLPLP